MNFDAGRARASVPNIAKLQGSAIETKRLLALFTALNIIILVIETIRTVCFGAVFPIASDNWFTVFTMGFITAFAFMYAIYTDHLLIVSHVFSIIAYIGDNLQGIPILLWISQQCKQFNSSVNILWGKHHRCPIERDEKKFPDSVCSDQKSYIFLESSIIDKTCIHC